MSERLDRAIRVAVSYRAGSYHARVVGRPYRSSCTAGDDQAALALARRFYGGEARVQRLVERPPERSIAGVDNAYLAAHTTRELTLQGLTHLIFTR